MLLSRNVKSTASKIRVLCTLAFVDCPLQQVDNVCHYSNVKGTCSY